MKKKIIRITTVPISLSGLLKGQLKFMSNYFNILGVTSNGKGDQLEHIEKQEGIPVVVVEMTRKITPIKDILAVWKLYKIFKTEKPFIVHSHTPKAGTLSMLAAKLACVPHRLHTIAGLPLVEATGSKRIILNLVEKTTYACATKIYPNSYGLTDIILNHKFTTQKKLKVIANGSSNGIDTSFFKPDFFKNTTNKKVFKDKLHIANDDFVFVFAGRLVSDKGINELLLAYDKICNTYKNVKLLLVGTYETELDPLLPESLNIINNNKGIISTGWVDDVRPYFAISNALVFPSYREGFPNVVMQAGAMELPSIVTNINGCNEIIEQDKHGFIIPVKNAEAIHQSMTFILNNKNKCIEMGKQSRINIVSKYERQKVWEALLDEYNNLK
ncbi:MAG: glycosyltransferase family 4 protein [Algibacter sp.]